MDLVAYIEQYYGVSVDESTLPKSGNLLDYTGRHDTVKIRGEQFDMHRMYTGMLHEEKIICFS